MSPDPIQPSPTKIPPNMMMIRGLKRSTNAPSAGTSQVSTKMKAAKATWTAAKEAPRLLVSGVVNRVHAYCRLAIAIMATTAATNCHHRLISCLCLGTELSVAAIGVPLPLKTSTLTLVQLAPIRAGRFTSLHERESLHGVGGRSKRQEADEERRRQVVRGGIDGYRGLQRETPFLALYASLSQEFGPRLGRGGDRGSQFQHAPVSYVIARQSIPLPLPTWPKPS